MLTVWKAPQRLCDGWPVISIGLAAEAIEAIVGSWGHNVFVIAPKPSREDGAREFLQDVKLEASCRPSVHWSSSTTENSATSSPRLTCLHLACTYQPTTTYNDLRSHSSTELWRRLAADAGCFLRDAALRPRRRNPWRQITPPQETQCSTLKSPIP